MSDDSAHDYDAVVIPGDGEEEPGGMEHFNTAQRRAWLLQEVYDQGTPTAINQSEVCEYFGVVQQTISRDLDELGDYVDGKLGNRSSMMSDSVFKTAVEDLVDEDPYKAAKVMEMFNEWLQTQGAQDREVETGDIEVTFTD